MILLQHNLKMAWSVFSKPFLLNLFYQTYCLFHFNISSSSATASSYPVMIIPFPGAHLKKNLHNCAVFTDPTVCLSRTKVIPRSMLFRRIPGGRLQKVRSESAGYARFAVARLSSRTGLSLTEQVFYFTHHGQLDLRAALEHPHRRDRQTEFLCYIFAADGRLLFVKAVPVSTSYVFCLYKNNTLLLIEW